jgi:hypothetical protein
MEDEDEVEEEERTAEILLFASLIFPPPPPLGEEELGFSWKRIGRLISCRLKPKVRVLSLAMALLRSEEEKPL